ncbi:hypothetical protein AYJ57_06970 [Salipiger sp. CCB-MM3]|uniref:alpha/beta fold hydrolase n=1 Tax=Roseobacteraceae TaxID=2854170 RepID=UPI00080AAED0|nr:MULTISPECIES: alpha/beta hydrolase [Roseobacteraceae]ANT60126.1 hypothetical protein AYJ57_06970 [Salipiger sp. CCB-MM3]MCA0995240.1 alpha/beta hydrolase [Alloyangia pacifica]
MSYTLGVIAAAIPVIAALPVVAELRRRPLTDLRRSQAPGKCVRLSHGRTHYQLQGPEDGPLVVCIHGLTAPSAVFHALTRHLVAQGKRVLIYDLYGRGFSDRPRGAQTPAFLMQQLEELLAVLDLKGPMTMLGYSLGAVVASAFTAENPKRVSRLVLVAPAGIESDLSSMVDWTLQHPICGSWLFHMVFPKAHRQNVIEGSDNRSEVPEIDQLHLDELKRRGFIRSVLSSLRGCLQEPQEAVHQRIAKLSVPVMAIWGAQDRMVRAGAVEQLDAWNPRVEQDIIPDAWHGLPHTHARELAALMADHDAAMKRA